MLAHKAMHEGKVAAEVIAGLPSAFDFQTVPSVVYTDPQIAVCALERSRHESAILKSRSAVFPGRHRARSFNGGIARTDQDDY